MSEMKMSKLFPEAFEVEHNKSFEVQNCHWVTFGEDFHSNCEQDDAIAHAVLNHDRLTEENQKLREALVLISLNSSFNTMMPHESEIVEKLLEQTR